MRRAALSTSERRELAEGIRTGNASSNLLASDDCPLDLLACPAAGSRGLVYFQGQIDEGEGLEPDEARRVARELLALADDAEFGPGEWRQGDWHRDELAFKPGSGAA